MISADTSTMTSMSVRRSPGRKARRARQTSVDSGTPPSIAPELLNETAIRLARDHGERWTQQRTTVVTVIAQADSHLPAEEVFTRARQLDPRIGQATVYRTLSLLVELGLVHQPPLGGQRAVFELAMNRKHHDHLVDIESREIIEFSNETIEDLQRVVAKHLGFELIGHHLVLYGRRLSP